MQPLQFDKKGQGEKVELTAEGMRKRKLTESELIDRVFEVMPWITLKSHNDTIIPEEYQLDDFLMKEDHESEMEFKIRSRLAHIIFSNSNLNLRARNAVALSFAILKRTQGYTFDQVLEHLIDVVMGEIR